MIVKADKNLVEIFFDNHKFPFLVQETWPDGTPWSSDAEAQAWADLYVLSLDRGHLFMPGVSPDAPEVPKPPQDEIDPETGEPIVVEDAPPAEPEPTA